MMKGYKTKFVSESRDRDPRAGEPALFRWAVAMASATDITLNAIEVCDVLDNDIIQDVDRRCKAITVGDIQESYSE